MSGWKTHMFAGTLSGVAVGVAAVKLFPDAVLSVAREVPDFMGFPGIEMPIVLGGIVAAGSVGAVAGIFPDVDQPGRDISRNQWGARIHKFWPGLLIMNIFFTLGASYLLGRAVWLIPGVLAALILAAKASGHRGMSHTTVFCLVFSGLYFLPLYLLGLKAAFVFLTAAAFAGMMSHLVLDGRIR